MHERESQRANRIVHAEYQDAQGYIHKEYKDAQGNIYTEYTDNKGILHSYKHAYADGRLLENQLQNEQDLLVETNESRGVLIGVTLAVLGVFILGTIYALTRPPAPEPLPAVVNVEAPAPNSPTTVAEKPSPSPSVTVIPVTQPTPAPAPVAEKPPVAQKPSVTVIPVTQPAPAQPSTVNITTTTTNPANPNPPQAAPAPVATATAPVATAPAMTDSSLTTAILKQFKDNLPNNQLTVEVKNAVVTISGKVATQEDLQQISPLLSSINGIKQTIIKATVAQ